MNQRERERNIERGQRDRHIEGETGNETKTERQTDGGVQKWLQTLL